MPEAITAGAVQAILNRYGLRPHKAWGQNFLIDKNIAEKIVNLAELMGEDVVEIGPGLGSLTIPAAQRARELVAIEIDRGLVQALAEMLAGITNVRVINGDALEVDFNAFFPQSYIILANLPYSITSPLLLRLCEKKWRIKRAVIMVQLEVARRLMASPGSKDYGSLTVAVGYCMQAEWLFKVPATAFWPRPEVDSAVIRLQPRSHYLLPPELEELFFRIVRASFGQRRKTLGNALAGGLPFYGKKEWGAILEKAGIAPERRGETLTLEEFATLTRTVADYRLRQLGDEL